MKTKFVKNLLVLTGLLVGLGMFLPINTYAEGENNSDESNKSSESTEDAQPGGTSISITPVSNVMQISSNSNYDETFTVNNDGAEQMRIEVYAAPYAYIHSEEDDTYKLGFNKENNFTQITRWITFKDNDGNYVKKANYTIEPNQSLEVNYRVSTPDNIPAGGQYAVIFAHTLSSSTSTNGIRTEASPGLVVYGRSSEGTVDTSAEISNLKIEQSITEGNTTKNQFFASAKVKNSGNVDFNAIGKMKVESIIGFGSYETPSTKGRISVIPEAELTVSDTWEETPSFGIYKVTWTVKAGDAEETIEKTIFLIPPVVIIITIIVLTFIVIWIIMASRKRKERRSRLAV